MGELSLEQVPKALEKLGHEECSNLTDFVMGLEVLPIPSGRRESGTKDDCDFKIIKELMGELLDSWDHAMAMNTDDPMFQTFKTAY